MDYLVFLKWQDIVLILFALSILVQVLYYLVAYMRAVRRNEKQVESQENSPLPPVSVIICANNQDENLSQNLVRTLEQDYPSFEVIVVNDCSEDDTELVLAELKQKYPHLRSTIIKKNGAFLNGKKFAATVGVRAAQHEWLLFTDADCCPESPKWIETMSRQFAENKSVVLGYGGYFAQKDFLNKWIRYDACFTALQYIGFALLGKAYTGVGRNLAYRKSLFFEHNGFAIHAHILSDDDGLFVNQAAKKNNVAATCIGEAHIRSKSPNTFKEWTWQKSRQISSGSYYRSSQVFWLTLEPLSRIIMWASFTILMIVCPLWYYVLAALIVRKAVFMTIIRAAVKKLNEPSILQYAVFFDMIMPFVYLYLFLLNRLNGNKRRITIVKSTVGH